MLGLGGKSALVKSDTTDNHQPHRYRTGENGGTGSYFVNRLLQHAQISHYNRYLRHFKCSYRGKSDRVSSDCRHFLSIPIPKPMTRNVQCMKGFHNCNKRVLLQPGKRYASAMVLLFCFLWYCFCQENETETKRFELNRIRWWYLYSRCPMFFLYEEDHFEWFRPYKCLLTSNLAYQGYFCL